MFVGILWFLLILYMFQVVIVIIQLHNNEFEFMVFDSKKDFYTWLIPFYRFIKLTYEKINILG